MVSCYVEFIDCAGYWDLVAEGFSLVFIFAIFVKTFNNYRYLRQQKIVKTQNQIQKSIKRKMIVNLLSMIYQISLFGTILFSIVLFLAFQNNSQQIKQHRLNSWYKWSQIIFINLLNSLNLTVGFLYWKAVRAYFKISGQRIPFIYCNFIKGLFFLVYGLNFIIIVLSLVLLIHCDQATYSNEDIIKINYLNSTSIILSSIICIISRILQQKNIPVCTKKGEEAQRKQIIYTFFIGFCCTCRICCMGFNLFQMDYTEFFRYFDQHCIDVQPYHAILMFFLTLCVNMLPAFIFSLIFSSMERDRKYWSQIQEILRNNTEDESVTNF